MQLDLVASQRQAIQSQICMSKEDVDNKKKQMRELNLSTKRIINDYNEMK